MDEPQASAIESFTIQQDLQWHQAIDILRPHVFRISTPRGSGTGFLVSHGTSSGVCGIATAAHVIDGAHSWEEPIRIEHAQSGKSLLARHGDRAIFVDHAHDTAAILIRKGDLPIPDARLLLAPSKKHYRVGNDLG